MTLEEYIVKYTTQGMLRHVGIDTDGVLGYQCMDNMHEYIRSVLGISDLRVLAAPNAISVWNNFPNVFGHDLFTKIANTPDGVPNKGDIVFFKQWPYLYGPDGHVCIYVDGDLYTLITFDQNYPTWAMPVLTKHSYVAAVNGPCVGWLRKR